MGTRARVNVYDGNEILLSIYRQMDGYPEGLGKEVASFVGGLDLVNGISDYNAPIANGMGCLAAQLVAHLKDGVGSVYIRDTSPESHGEEYVYNIKERDGKVWLEVLKGGMTMFGLPGDKEEEMKLLYSGFASKFEVPKEEPDA